MCNYVKSEWYRITHSYTIYLFTGILSVLTLLLNIVLFLFDKFEEGFQYGTVAFSLGNIAHMTILFYMGMIVAILLFAGEKKHGALKNAIAFGFSRTEIFLGKCIVSTAISLCSMVVILVVYIGSAVLLLEPGVEPDAVAIILKGVACNLIMAVAFEILAIMLSAVFEKEMVGLIVWYLIMTVIPQICRMIGLRSELFSNIAAWMPHNYLGNEVVVTMSGWSCLWQTPEGVAKCLIAGVTGLIVFLLLGLVICKKQEV